MSRCMARVERPSTRRHGSSPPAPRHSPPWTQLDMTPAKRRPATPAGKGPTRVAPDVPTSPPDAPVPDELVTAPGPPAATKDSTELLGPDGEPIAEEAPTGDASGH